MKTKKQNVSLKMFTAQCYSSLSAENSTRGLDSKAVREPPKVPGGEEGEQGLLAGEPRQVSSCGRWSRLRLLEALAERVLLGPSQPPVR